MSVVTLLEPLSVVLEEAVGEVGSSLGIHPSSLNMPTLPMYAKGGGLNPEYVK
tara:strand:+ start:1993 stop:2151 length:159 start_codon:yes stop_codon:yes gene_type:complete